MLVDSSCCWLGLVQESSYCNSLFWAALQIVWDSDPLSFSISALGPFTVIAVNFLLANAIFRWASQVERVQFSSGCVPRMRTFFRSAILLVVDWARRSQVRIFFLCFVAMLQPAF